MCSQHVVLGLLQYHVYPSSATELVRSVAPLLFMYVTDADTGVLTGYSVTVASHQVCLLHDTTVCMN